MLVELIKALLIGIIASAPPGPVWMLVLQKTFCHGRQGGFAAGAGSAVVDTLFAVASLLAHIIWILIIGGLLVSGVGLVMLRRKPMKNKTLEDTTKTKAAQFALQAAGCVIANPGALAFMFALVALFRLDIGSAVSPTWAIVLFIFLGALLWWFSFTYIADKMRNNFNVKTINRVNKFAGYAVLAFGAVLFIRGILLI